jgi:very-short-patch-repair endonuclease
MKPRHKPLDDVQKNRARDLRQQATVPERLLWGRLRAGRLAGLKFRRQHPIDRFIIDFYCDESKLAVELDGASHQGRAQYDAQRTAFLQGLGIRVVRIGNDDVLRSMDAVLKMILRECQKN